VLVEHEPRRALHPDAGAQPRTYALTDAGRAAFPHAYDDLATSALRYLRDSRRRGRGGRFATRRAASLEEAIGRRCRAWTLAERAEGRLSA